MPSSEADPLLPKGHSAPEISGYGFSKPSRWQSNSRDEITDDLEDDKDKAFEQASQTARKISPLRILLTLITITVGLAIFIALLIPGSWDALRGTPSDDASDNRERVNKILNETPLLDGHNDLAILIRALFQNYIYGSDFTDKFENGGLYGQVDHPRLKKGKVGGSFWSAFTPCPANGSDFSDANYVESVSMTLSQIDLVHRLTSAYPNTFSPPSLSSNDTLSAFKKFHCLISPIGIEGLHQIGNSYSNLRLYHSLGVKYATLTHNCHNLFADAALNVDTSGQLIAAPVYWGGLSEKGQILVREMNRMGVLVDLAHVSKDTMLDVLGARPEKFAGSKAPIMFSHSSAYALCPHPRNVEDDVLQLVKSTNSIVMVNFAPDFISCVESNSSTGIPELYPPNATLHQVARHVAYIGDLIGYDHVGLGSDFDGIPTVPKGLEDVSKFPDLVAELLRFGVTDEDVAKVVGMNVLRVWGEAEKVAVQMQKDGVKPVQDHVEKMHIPA